MNQHKQIDRSLVAIFDIEAFSEHTPEGMARLVAKFWELLSEYLTDIAHLRPDTFSTGDGAIISLGRQCSIEATATKKFIQFIIDFTIKLCSSGVSVRTSINYSEGDRIVFGPEHTLKDQYMQVGDTINIAARILSFCEPRELMISASVHNLMRVHELLSNFRFFHNEPLVTKHGVRLDTYTYFPPEEFGEALYSPNSPLHPYKRFTAFPPIDAKTLSYFMSSGLEIELRRTVLNVYDAMNYINETKTFLSSTEVVKVLTRPNYDPQDKVYVVSRNDRSTGFWTQKRRNQYISFLKGNASRHGGHINQKRIMVFEDDEGLSELMPIDDIHNDFMKLHKPGTYYNFRSSLLYPYERIFELIFGFTLSTKHKYAIIPVPGTDIETNNLRTEHFGELLQLYSSYDIADGPMKAIITADEKYVGALISEFENMIEDPIAELLK